MRVLNITYLRHFILPILAHHFIAVAEPRSITYTAVKMVKLEEVPDEDLNAPQMGPKSDEDEWDTDDGASDASLIH